MKGSCHIMLIDDDGDDKEFFLMALKKIDPCISSVTAKDGIDALKILDGAATLPDFIFLDLNMPRMNGIQCLIALKKSEKLKHIPVAIYSTTRREEDEAEIRKQGAIHFFTKPTSLQEVCECISAALALTCK